MSIPRRSEQCRPYDKQNKRNAVQEGIAGTGHRIGDEMGMVNGYGLESLVWLGGEQNAGQGR